MKHIILATAILIAAIGCSNAELETAQAELAEVKLELTATQAELADALNWVAHYRENENYAKEQVAQLESDAKDAALVQSEFYHRGVEEGLGWRGVMYNKVRACYENGDFALQNKFCDILQLSACRYSEALVEAGRPPFWEGANIGNCNTHLKQR